LDIPSGEESSSFIMVTSFKVEAIMTYLAITIHFLRIIIKLKDLPSSYLEVNHFPTYTFNPFSFNPSQVKKITSFKVGISPFLTTISSAFIIIKDY